MEEEDGIPIVTLKLDPALPPDYCEYANPPRPTTLNLICTFINCRIMSATKSFSHEKRYNSLDKKVAEERDVNDAIEAEMENGAAKRDEQEKIKSLLADTDKLIGNEEATRRCHIEFRSETTTNRCR